MLLAQQANRFAEILGEARAPLSLAAEIMAGLLPSILIFTIPMAVLIGTATGFSRMGSDSEMIALRAAGVGMWRIAAPMLLFGVVTAASTLWVGMELAPLAARDLRRAASSAALYKLESPVDPRTFNTEMSGKVIYVRDGDKERGQWGRVFIHWQEKNGAVRLVTARTGRIDASGERAELVLSDAVVTTLPSALSFAGISTHTDKGAQITTERSAQLRVRDDRLNAQRGALMRRLRERELGLDEMGWRELRQRASVAPDDKTRRAASTTLHKRLALCSAPLIFAMLGTGIGLRTRRGGRGLGVLLSLGIMIIYYLVALAGEQMARTGILPATLGAWLPTGLSAVFGGMLLISETGRIYGLLRRSKSNASKGERLVLQKRKTFYTSFPGLFDRNVTGTLARNFGVAFIVLVAIFLIFTLFELLRFISANGASATTVALYLLYLLPFVSVALAPMSMLVAVLVSYAVMSRRNEAVAWWASGQSVYRLALPGIVFALWIGVGMWFMQEYLLPTANLRQNALRAQIQGRIARTVTSTGRQWLATSDGRQLYAYEYNEADETLNHPIVYEFDEEGVHLRRMVWGQHGIWTTPDTIQLSDAVILEIREGKGDRFGTSAHATLPISESLEAFKPTLKSAAEMDTKQLSEHITTLKRRGGAHPLVSALSVSLERKRADPFTPIVMALIGIPLALAFGRRSALVALCAAIGIGLAFWGVVSGAQQLGDYALLPPPLAAWSPLVVFACAGIYLLFRART